MSPPRWLDERLLRAIHAEQLAEHGGAKGVRDAGLLASAVARPRNKEAYADADLFELAAAYAFGIARSHPFVDGNKRTALVASFAFFAINGWDMDVAETAAGLPGARRRGHRRADACAMVPRERPSERGCGDLKRPLTSPIARADRSTWPSAFLLARSQAAHGLGADQSPAPFPSAETYRDL